MRGQSRLIRSLLRSSTVNSNSRHSSDTSQLPPEEPEVEEPPPPWLPPPPPPAPGRGMGPDAEIMAFTRWTRDSEEGGGEGGGQWGMLLATFYTRGGVLMWQGGAHQAG